MSKYMDRCYETNMGDEMLAGPTKVFYDGQEIGSVVSITEHSSVDEITSVTIKLYGVTKHTGDGRGRRIDIITGVNVESAGEYRQVECKARDDGVCEECECRVADPVQADWCMHLQEYCCDAHRVCASYLGKNQQCRCGEEESKK